MNHIRFPPPIADDMVRAILADRKTVTCRVMKPQPKYCASCQKDLKSAIYDVMADNLYCGECGWWLLHDSERFTPPYRPGDILYVRETFCRFNCACCDGDTLTGECLAEDGPDENEGCWRYRASNKICGDAKWRPSIHMPREAARIFLRVTEVRVQQLKDVTEEDARAEGFYTRAGFIAAILKMYPDCTEDSWLWVIEFERIRREEADGGAMPNNL